MKKTVTLTDNHMLDRLRIFKMMEASCELAIQKGRHELEKGCNCIACVNKRKRILHGSTQKWKFTL